jgi:O-succinylbenzoic acid--CoA ligase
LDRVAALAQNSPELVALLFALRRLGATLVPLNTRLTSFELGPLIAQVEPKIVLADGQGRERWTDATLLHGFEAKSPPHPCPLPQAGEGRLAPWLILFTSGTTGSPKAAQLSVANLEASACASGENLGTHASQRWLGTLPLFHIGGLAMAVRCARYGATLVLHPRFDPDAAQRALKSGGITHASFVPQTLEAVLDGAQGAFGPAEPVVLLGGGPASPRLLARARAAGLSVLCTYGLTEASSQVCTERPGHAQGDSAGPPLPGVSVRIVDGAGRDVPRGAEGEVWVQGPTVMMGYFPAEHAPDEALVDGWLRTGDVGMWDDEGGLRLLTRRVDLILSGGENVYPAELEAVLAAHPSVQEAAVVGDQDARWGEVPVAFIVSNGTEALEGLQAFARERLAGFKVPKRFERVEFLPRNAMGKVDRAALKARLVREVP